jgi:hypothetical protein
MFMVEALAVTDDHDLASANMTSDRQHPGKVSKCVPARHRTH